MTSRELVIGVDVGTTVTKAVAFDVDGVALRRAAQPTELHRAGPGRYEQDADQVVDSVTTVLAELLVGLRAGPAGDGAENPGPDPAARVLAVGVTGQGDGVWLVDGQGRAVHPALSWLDARATPIVERWSAEGLLTTVFRRTGSLLFPGAAGPLLAWLDAHEPAALDRATTAAYCKDVVLQRLTGVRATDPSDASVPFLDPHTHRYDDELLAACGLAHRRDLLAPVEPTPHGALSTAAAERIGLPGGIPVVAAPYDLPASAWGAGVEEVGAGLLTVGTTLACQVVTDKVDTAGTPMGLTLSGWQDRRWLRALPAMVGTAGLDWVLRLVGATTADLPELLATGDGAGMTVLPFFAEAGERAPFVAPHARALIDGLHLGVSRADLVRATCEAIAYSARHNLTAAGLRGPLAACGGGIASPQWAQIFADVLDRPVRALAGEEVGARGAALAALRALGRPATAAGWRPAGVVYEPDPARRERYAAGYARYLDRIDQVRPLWTD